MDVNSTGPQCLFLSDFSYQYDLNPFTARVLDGVL